ncbi:glutathione S-transferase family protein [Sphingobium sufflavum]|uniref:glutathione S-transferase family protein n=1 Tax=Sphingobium sufflavum TaxID=1129547 RepID=UPI001F1D0268|nr:glutathione S-transferase family protein [Sphingobium sufflavum]MCE7795805.1 glutathione S-transferase family protein [Sphingobium sufflavum]
MLTIHHLGGSQSERIVWLCEELGLPYDLVRYDRDPQTRAAPPEYKALHPAGTAPVIRDGAVTLAETGAIMDYIVRRHGKSDLTPGPEHPDFAPFLFWYHYANGSMMPAIMMDLVAQRLGAPVQTPGLANGRTDTAFRLVEERLGEAPWFAGADFSAADIMMAFPLSTMRLYSRRDISDSPNLQGWLRRIGARPAYRAAMARAEPDRAPLLD